MTLRQRMPREKDNKHIAWIRQQPCVICGDNTTTEAAHIRTASLDHGKPHTGMAEKPSDKWVLPLCGQHHREQHHTGDELKFWDFHGINPFLEAMKMRAK